MNASVQPPADEPVKASHHLRAGLIAGITLQAARLSAGLSPAELAEALELGESAIRVWEDGTEPLASIPVQEVDLVKDALHTAGADRQLVADLDPAAWCDVILMAMDSGEDTSCLLADPLASEPNFAELFGWAITGRIPARYNAYAPTETPPNKNGTSC